MAEIADFETTILPLEDFANIASAAKYGLVNMGSLTVQVPDFSSGFFSMRNIEIPHLETAMGYLEELAKDPSKGSHAWQRALVATGVGVAGSTAALPVLIAATGPLAPLAVIGLGIGSVFLGKNRSCTLLVANSTIGELIQEALHIDVGVQTGRPVIEEADMDTGRKIATKPNTIPGVRTIEGDPEFDIPDMMLGGLGLYRFEKDLSLWIGFYGTGGAIAFRGTDSYLKEKRFAVAWLVPETGRPAFAVTADLYGEYESLKEFYDQTAGARKSINMATGKARGATVATINASLIHRGYPDTSNDGDLLLTVCMSRK